MKVEGAPPVVSRDENGQDRVLDADRALRQRPSMGIPVRVGISMSVAFLLTAAVTIAWMVSVERVGATQRLLEEMNDYTLELDQARRFEKNYLLYGTDLDEALNNISRAHQLLSSLEQDIITVAGPEVFFRMQDNLLAYERNLEDMEVIERESGQGGGSDVRRFERELRRHGAQVQEDAKGLRDQERLRLHAGIRTSRIVATGSLVFILMAMAYMTHSLVHQILSPLKRFTKYTHSIAAGDFSPIVPVRRFKDEFSDLALALNRMLAELKHRQEQLARSSRMAAVGTLTAGIAHELNNPLNNISLITEALLEGFDSYEPGQRNKMLGDIQVQLERAGGTVRNLLDFTRIEKPVLMEVSIEEVVDQSTRLLDNEFRMNDIELVRDFSGNLRVQASPRDLQQVFLNLFTNAIHAMTGGGTLTVKASPADEGMIRIDVSDTGVGIPEEHLSSVFDPFFTTKEMGEGTGLGLSVSYSIIEKHHGRIEVASRVGAGTTFSVYLPTVQEGQTLRSD